MRPMITGAGSGAGGGPLMEKQSLSLVPAVQELWNAWEVHCLIVASLLLQVFLFLFAGMRQRCSGRFLQLVLWLAYLSADSVAIFVLGNLAVRASEPGHELMSFWAPFLLVHLGGQDTITAFSKQDNELYWRHLLNLVTQVAVAGYVVAKASWPDARLRAAMVLMLLCGCFKYAERAASLCTGSSEWLRGWGEFVLSRKLKGMHHERGELFLTETEGTREEARKNMEHTLSMMSKDSSRLAPELFWDAIALIDDIISVDTPVNQVHNITIAANGEDLPAMLGEFVRNEHRHNAYQHVGALLGHCYRRFYTKGPLREVFIQSFSKVPLVLVTSIRILFLLWALFPCVSTSIALAIFMAAEKGDQQLHASRVDIIVTYLLLVGAIVLDVSSAAHFIFSHLSFYLPARILNLGNCIQPAWCKKQWSQDLKQYNMINSAGMSRIWIWRLFACNVTGTTITEDRAPIKEFILDTLLHFGVRKAWNIASTRGQLALHSRQQEHSADSARMTLKTLEETIRSDVDFPTSVLIWHIATDMCYYSGGTDNFDQVEKHKQISREISDYIMYLVFKCRVMLTTNSQIVHDNVNDEIVDILSKFRHDNLGKKDAVMKHFEIQMEHVESESEEQKDLMDDVQTEHEELANNSNAADNHMKRLQHSTQDLKSPVLPRACAVAQKLISIEDDAARWELISAVWAEMLYYTAPRCGGDFHYEHLSTGGEFITHVLVLMYYLGPFLPPPGA